MKVQGHKGHVRNRLSGVVVAAGLLESVVVLAKRTALMFIARTEFVILAMETPGLVPFNRLERAFLFFLLMFIASCSFRPSDKDVESLIYTPLKTTEEVDDLLPYISDLEVFPVGSDGAARPGISKILFAEPIVFLSGGVVFSASPDWERIIQVGNVGRGPEEYLSVKDIVINSGGDELWCMDVLNSILRFDLKTFAFLGKIECEKNGYARAMIPQENNHVVLYTPNPPDAFPEKHETFYCMSIYNSSGKTIDQQLPWTQYNVMAGFSNPVSIEDNSKYILTPESSYIAYVFDNNRIDYQIVFNFGSKWIPSNFINPKDGDHARKVGDLFDMDCFKLISSVYFPDDNLYFHAFGKESSSWNFYMSKDGTHGIRWCSVGIMTPPISAIASKDGFLYFVYDDYGHVKEEQDPLKKCVIQKFGKPDNTESSYLIKVKFNVE